MIGIVFVQILDMKKIFTLLLLLNFTVFFGQTKLVSHPLELKNPSSYHQILNAVNADNQVFVFACDREQIHLLKFNSALFFSDSLTIKRPAKNYEILAGYNFGTSGNPFLYWASQDFKKILSIEYDLSKKSFKTVESEIPFKNEIIAASFTENNNFYILSQKENGNELKLYVFNNGSLIEQSLDFSAFKITDEKEKPKKLSTLLNDNPIEKIDSKQFNPLFFTVQKTKLYTEDNKIILSLDHNSLQTQLFSIDLTTFTITEKIIPQPQLEKQNGKSNSYFHKQRLYQIKLNEKQMVFEIKNYLSGEIIKTFSVKENDSITFRNSPLYLQTGNQRPRDLKTTKKFLRRLSTSDIGISVYDNQGTTLATIGRVKNVPSTGNVLLGVSLGVGIAMGGGNVIIGDFIEEDNVQSIYLESLLDENSQHITGQPEPLAVDYISQFLAQKNNIENNTTFSYKDFYILGYYDTSLKEYVLRKFQDGL